MGNLANTIPFTELWERLLTMSRLDSPNNEDYARGMINDVYTRALPRSQDWAPLVKEGNLTMTAYYNTGTVTITAGSTSLTGSGTTWTSAMTATDGYKIKIAGNDNIYTFTYVGATSGTISPALSGATDLSAVSYQIYRDEYSLASDFSRLLKNGSVYAYSGGNIRDIIKELPHDIFRDESTVAATDPIIRVMLGRTHSSTGYRLLKVNPPPKTAKVYPYEYIQQVTPMTDYNTGTVAVTNGSANVVGTDTLWATNVAVGDYFRVDANGTGDASKWYKVLTVTDDTNIVLSGNYGEATESLVDYTICKAPTAFPMEFHEFILYDAVVTVVGQEGDPSAQAMLMKRESILQTLKNNYKSRTTNQQYAVDDDGLRSYQR